MRKKICWSVCLESPAEEQALAFLIQQLNNVIAKGAVCLHVFRSATQNVSSIYKHIPVSWKLPDFQMKTCRRKGASSAPAFQVES